MSYLLYSTRVWWDGRNGVAALRGHYRKMSVAPQFLPSIAYIDYAPEVRVAQLRPEFEAMRDMTSDEIAAADAWLHQMFPAQPVSPQTLGALPVMAPPPASDEPADAQDGDATPA